MPRLGELRSLAHRRQDRRRYQQKKKAALENVETRVRRPGGLRHWFTRSIAAFLIFAPAAAWAWVVASHASPIGRCAVTLARPCHHICGRPLIRQFACHECHVRIHVRKEFLVRRAKIVQPRLAIRSLDETVLGALAVACAQIVAVRQYAASCRTSPRQMRAVGAIPPSMSASFRVRYPADCADRRSDRTNRHRRYAPWPARRRRWD